MEYLIPTLRSKFALYCQLPKNAALGISSFNLPKFQILLFLLFSSSFLHSQQISQVEKLLDKASTIEEKLSIIAQEVMSNRHVEKEVLQHYLNKAKNMAASENNPKIEIYYQLLKAAYFSYHAFDKDTLLQCLSTGIELAKQYNFQEELSDLYYKSGNFLVRSEQYEKGIDAFKRALLIEEKLANTRNMAAVLHGLAVSYEYLGKYDIALPYYDQSLQLQEVEKDPKIYLTLLAKAILLNKSGNQRQSLEIALEALDLAKDEGDKYAINAILINIGVFQKTLGDFEGAKKSAHETLLLAKEVKDQAQIFSSLYNIGYAHLELKEYKLANEHFFEALSIVEQAGINGEQINVLLHLATIAFEQEEIESSLTLLEKAKKLSSKEYLPQHDIRIRMGLIQVYLEQEDGKKAISLLQEMDQEVENSFDYEEKMRYEELAAKAYHLAGDYPKAYASLDRFNFWRDSVINNDKIRASAKMIADFEYEKEKEQTALLHEEELKREGIIRNALLIGLGLVLIFLVFLFRLYQSKERLNTQLTELNQTKDQIFAVLGHDLRKPAISLRGITEKIRYLIRKEDFVRLAQLGQTVEENAYSLNKLTDNLLNWALNEKNAIRYQPIAIPLQSVIMEIVDLFQTIVEDKEITLKSAIPSDLKVYADLNSITIILRNLIDNAIKYTPSGGSVVLTAEKEEHVVSLYIKDTGIGIPQERLKTLFSLDSRKSQIGTAGEKGTGLGLYLVQQLTKLNQGLIKVTSQPAVGSTFQLQFPKS